MILASRKVISIALLFFVVNEVNSTPSPVPKVPEFFGNAWSSMREAGKKRMVKARESIENFLRKQVNKLASKVLHPEGKLLRNFDCFSRTHFFAKPFDLFFTDKTTEGNVKFYFASRKNSDYKTVQLQNNSFSLDHVDFDPLIDTVVITHGFQSNGRVEWLKDMKDAFLQKGEYNVIVVDWEKGSNTWNYIDAAATTQIVGNELAKFFGYIYDQKVKEHFNADADILGNLHFIGHSLGSHIVARAANKIKEDQEKENRSDNWIVKRITGLDPAQPCFILPENDKKLDKNDAEFVDVIHTNARHLMLMGLGLPQRLGDYDFYPNGGQMQPGCVIKGLPLNVILWTYRFKPKTLLNATVCSHGRSYEFFTESIHTADDNSCQFISHPWDRTYNQSFDELEQGTCDGRGCPQMGINSINYVPRRKGIYFTLTSRQKPYCVNGITGLDPAQPCFILPESDKRLDKSDAEFVDAIHTNAQHPLAIDSGMPTRMGYADFYPNGGKIQIGCESRDTSTWSDLGLPIDSEFC